MEQAKFAKWQGQGARQVPEQQNRTNFCKQKVFKSKTKIMHIVIN